MRFGWSGLLRNRRCIGTITVETTKAEGSKLHLDVSEAGVDGSGKNNTLSIGILVSLSGTRVGSRLSRSLCLDLSNRALGGGRRVESRWTRVGSDWLGFGLGLLLSILDPLGLVSGSSRSSNCWVLPFLLLCLFGQ